MKLYKLLSISLILLCTLGSFSLVQAQNCIEGTLVLDDQEDIDNFPQDYPGCTIVDGKLLIRYSDITSLDSLYLLQEVNQLEIYQTQNLHSLQGIHQLSTVGALIIDDNSGLDSIVGFNNLQSVSELLKISDNNGLTKISGFNTLTSCNDLSIESNGWLESVEGFEILEDFTGFFVIGSNSSLSQLPNFDQIEVFKEYASIAGNSNLSQLPNFNRLKETQGGLLISQNGMTALTGFDSLRVSSGITISENEQLTSIDAFHNLESLNGRLEFSRNILESVSGFNNLKYIESLWFEYEDFLTTVPSFSELHRIDAALVVANTKQLTALPDFNKLESIGSAIRFTYNLALSDITSLENVDLLSIQPLGFRIQANSALSNCAIKSFCEYIFYNENNYLSGNVGNCMSSDQVLESCDNQFAKIYALPFYDENENNILDENDFPLSNINFQVAPSGNRLISNAEGQAVYFSTATNETITISLDEEIWLPSNDTTEYTVDIIDSTTTDTVHFALTPSVLTSGSHISIQSPPLRCNSWQPVTICITNSGNTIMDGTFHLKVDTLVQEYTFPIPPQDTSAEHGYAWDFTTLIPGASYCRTVNIQVPGIQDVPDGLLRFEGFAEVTDPLGEFTIETFFYRAEVRCSFDPNDKLVHPNREGEENYTLFEEPLKYTVRFQNTGNDVAYDILLRDQLDPQLDPSTFQFLATSHPEHLRIDFPEEDIIEFNFEKIFLSDSTNNEPESHGYVSFLIRPFDNIVENTVIENSAGIFFDFNPVVLTNTTVNTYVSELPTQVVTLPDTDIRITPNPATDYLYLDYPVAEAGQVYLIDLHGRIIQRLELQQQIKIGLNGMGTGVYFLQIITERGIKTVKFYCAK